jgi:hypothetical protein
MPFTDSSLTFDSENQVTPFNFTTPDHETIYAWHVMPLWQYAKHEAEIIQQTPGCADDVTKTKAFQLLRDDEDSKLIINCGYFMSTLQPPADDTQFTEYDQTREVSSAMLTSLSECRQRSSRLAHRIIPVHN